jgi:hypothetical protein
VACIAWLGNRLSPPSICNVQVGSLERGLLQERLVVCITVPMVRKSSCRKEYRGIRKGFFGDELFEHESEDVHLKPEVLAKVSLC